ncbi:nucleoporin Nup186/Nup192/Nup205 [Absidia repens]|uniref:Nucleoporin Nup186/Nup192/Nup205 n=1 Tax=Absidia repens TaxID=90262 RepID=A0A1X2IP83_9FUNG|nr:nucleoporin Nup186/Nup192/Nup205 [Absidia repens]
MAHNSSTPTWTEQARCIHDIVCQARYESSATAAQDLQHHLLSYTSLFINLLDDIPKNSNDRRILQSGNAFIHGVERSINTDFIHETTFLSDQLNIHEWVAATLLTCGKNASSRTGASAIDASVLLYYDEKLYLLATLDVILASIKDDSVDDTIRSVFHGFILELMQTEVELDDNNNNTRSSSFTTSSSASNGTIGSFVSKLLQANNRIKAQIISVSGNGGMAVNSINNGNGAPTTTTVSATGGFLGEDITSKRLDRMADERIYIVQILYHLASLIRLPHDDIFSMLELLQLSDLTDVTVPYLMTALLAAISPVGYEEDEMTLEDNLLSDVSFIDRFHEKFLGNLFKVPAIKAVVALQWCLFVCRARACYEQVESFTVVTEQVTSQLIDGAIETKAFQFLNDYILYFQQPITKLDTDRQLLKNSVIKEMEDAADDLTIDPTDFTKFNADIRHDFHPFVLFELEKLVLGMIEKMNNVLQKLKYREEDSNQYINAPLESDNALISSNENGRFNELERFFTLLASIYRDRLNTGAKFWVQENNYLYTFIQWAVDIKVAGTAGACYDFFGSISTGDQCATLAYEFLNTGTDYSTLASSTLFSWGKLFATLQFYVKLLHQGSTKGELGVLPPAEEDLLIKFLYLLQRVVMYSTKARSELWTDNEFQASDSVLNMLKYISSTTLRASLYDTLAAFCTSWGGGINGFGASLSGKVWEMLERSNDFVISAKTQAPGVNNTDGSNLTTSMDVEQQPKIMQYLEAERSLHIYPQTLSVLRLFGSAIHTQSKRDELISGFQRPPCTLPSSLGKETRTPGGKPYVTLVIDDIFLQLSDQQYKHPGAKWQLSSAALRVLENSILSFDLQQLEELTATNNKKVSDTRYIRSHVNKRNGSMALQLQALLLQYVTHPGYNVMVEILSGGAFCKQLLNIIEHGNEYGPFFIECIVRALRIIYQVLQIQSSFCNVLVPYITGLSNRSVSAEFKLQEFTFAPLPTLVPLGDHLLCQANCVVQIAMLMNCEDHEEICYLSTKILDALSTESKHDNAIKKGFEYAGAYAPMGGLGTKLAVVLNACKDAPSIVYGVGERLEIEQPETISCDEYQYDINNIPFWLAEATLADTYNFDDDLTWLRRTWSVRIAILDLLLENAATDRTSPSLTEFILGYMDLMKNGSGFMQRQNTDSLSITFTAILEMIRVHSGGGTRADADGMDTAEDDEQVAFSRHSPSLIETHPILAEKCYQLVYRLCAKESTSTTTLRYLRNEEEFFSKQFKVLSARLGSIASVPNPTFPGSMVCPDGSIIKTDFFRLLSMLHQRAWLLKSLALELHHTSGMQQKSEVVKLLNLLFGQHLDVPGSSATAVPFVHSGTFEQDLVKILEIGSSLEFRWDDDLMNNVEVVDFTFDIFTTFKGSDFQILNERQCLVYDIRTIYSKLWEHRSKLIDTTEQQTLEKEIGVFLQSLVAENHVREIVHGRVHCLRAWKQVVQVALTECFDYFPTEARQPIIYALLASILPNMRPKNGFDTDLLKGLSELVSTLMIQLRGKKQSQSGAIISSTTTTATNQMDSAQRLPDDKVIQLFVGIMDAIQEDSTTVAVRGDMYTALVNLLQYIRKHYPPESQQTTRSMESRLVALLSSRYGTILDTICNDACDGLGIWRTTAFTALNSLYILTSQVDDTKFLALLVKRNFIRYTVDMIRTDDITLMTILTQTEGSLLPLYIYESKISLCIDVASKRNGAQLLLENGILEVLGHCEFIGARPKSSSNKDVDTILMTRYHQLLLPTLRLIVTLLYSVGRVNGFLLEKVEGWYVNDANLTLALLTELKFVVAIMYYLSCRPGYFKNLLSRNLNHLHVSIVKLLHHWSSSSDNILNRVIPANNEERVWANQQASGPNATSIHAEKSRKLVDAILNYMKAYDYNAKMEAV